MIFKHAITHERATLILFDTENDRVILEAETEGMYFLTVEQFYKTFEYCWMPSK